MPIYTIDGQDIYVEERGRPERQKAILIHGWSSSWYALSPLLDLVAQRYHCLAVDLPGYGQSPPFPFRTTIPAYADLIARLIEEYARGPVVLIGHSMGGMISLTLALHYPAIVERMVLIGPTITGRLSQFINTLVFPVNMLERFGLGSLIVSAVERAAVGVTDRLMRPASFAERSGITAADYARLRADARRPGQGRVRAECYWAMRANNLSGKLHAIETPGLVIWGAEDNTVPLRDAGVVADEWPAADLRILPKAGHWPQFEAPDVTRRLVASYLGLPLTADRLQSLMSDEDLLRATEIAQFLTNSVLGKELNQAQRIRLAAQCVTRVYEPGETIAVAQASGDELYIVYSGTVEVWNDPEAPYSQRSSERRLQKTAVLQPGAMAGEVAMFDQGQRTADLKAGPEGAVVLVLSRERLLALCEDDAVLGTRLLLNLATAMTQRMRFILWQLERAQRRLLEGENAARRSARPL